MKRDAGLPLTVLLAGLCLAASPAAAAPGFMAAPASGVSGPAPRFAPMRPIARPGHAYRRHAGYYGGGYPGFYGGQQTVVVLPEASEPPPVKEPSIPVAIGIPRPPAADPVLYRIETYRGRPIVRVMRFSSDGRVARR